MEDDQQFCLRWNNHQSTLVAVFDTLLENGTLVDCTLAAEGKYLNAHKVVLSACSPYFEALLSQNYDKHPIFILKDVKYQELKAMMDYMYRGEVNISQDQLGALLKAAESLQIKGLSDNRKGETETRKTAPPPPPAKSPPPATSLPRVQGLTIEQRRREMEETREGSQSPGARKKKRIRRRSLEEQLDNHHDASNSSESHHSSHTTPAQNIPATLPAASSKILTDVPEPIETKSEILTRHKTSESEVVPQVPIIKEKIETHSELMLEPKAEYIEEMNEDSIEDLTLDDDDISNMEQMDDQGAGPSHGNMGEGSGQEGFSGFGGWHMGNQSQDEVFLAAQEAVGAHRDSQDNPKKSKYTCKDCGKEYTQKHNLLGHTCTKQLFGCTKCNRRYAHKSSLERHMKDHSGEEDKSQGVKDNDVTALVAQELNKDDEARDKNNSHEENDIDTSPTVIKDDNSKDIDEESRYICNACGKSYTQKHNLLRHILHVCRKQKQFDCTICDRRFTYKLGLTRHMEAHAAIEKKDQDVKDKDDKEGANEEVNKDDAGSDDDNLENSIASNTSTSAKDDNAKDAETPSIFPCHTCGRSYLKRYTLKRHIRHSDCKLLQEMEMETDDHDLHDDKPESESAKGQEDEEDDDASADGTQRLWCHKCSNSYSTRSNLVKHLKECGVTMKCIYCNRGYKHKAAFDNHLLTCNIKKYLV